MTDLIILWALGATVWAAIATYRERKASRGWNEALAGWGETLAMAEEIQEWITARLVTDTTLPPPPSSYGPRTTDRMN